MIITEERLAKIIFSARKGRGLTQQEVSLETGITQGALSKIEANSCSVSAKHWFLLSELLDIPHLVVNTGFIDRGVKPKPDKQNNYRLGKRYYENAYSSVKDLIPFISYVEDTYGEKKLQAFYKSVGLHPSYFINLNNPINIIFLLDLIKYFFDSHELPKKIIGEIAKRATIAAYHGVHHNIYSKKSSSLGLLQSYLYYGPYYDQNYTYRILNKTSHSISFEMIPGTYLKQLDPKEHKIIHNIMVPYRKKYIENFSNLGGLEGLVINSKEQKNQAIHFVARLASD